MSPSETVLPIHLYVFCIGFGKNGAVGHRGKNIQNQAVTPLAELVSRIKSLSALFFFMGSADKWRI